MLGFARFGGFVGGEDGPDDAERVGGRNRRRFEAERGADAGGDKGSVSGWNLGRRVGPYRRLRLAGRIYPMSRPM
jgi:hypothetical protein